jgi:Zn-dependent protease with chaperone function
MTGVRVHTFFLLLVIAAMQGCAAGSSVDVPTSNGRLQSIAATLVAPLALNKPLSIRVYPSTELAAFSRSDGRVFVSTALLEQLTDEELAAAIAHEIGHMVNHGDATISALAEGVVAGPGERNGADSGN